MLRWSTGHSGLLGSYEETWQVFGRDMFAAGRQGQLLPPPAGPPSWMRAGEPAEEETGDQGTQLRSQGDEHS